MFNEERLRAHQLFAPEDNSLVPASRSLFLFSSVESLVASFEYLFLIRELLEHNQFIIFQNLVKFDGH